ncbi:hypothetical protein [Flexivirga lutea]
MTAVSVTLAQRPVRQSELRTVTDRLTAGAHASISARTRTRALAVLARATGEDFELLLPSDGVWRLISGPADRLGAELVGLATMLEDVTGTGPTSEASPLPDIPPLAPGELLALAEVIRQGDCERLDAARDELELPGLPWWVTQFAWGAEAVLALRLTAPGIEGFATMLHLLPGGWGCLSADADDDLAFRPMTSIQVQARINAFADLLQGCAHANH